MDPGLQAPSKHFLASLEPRETDLGSNATSAPSSSVAGDKQCFVDLFFRAPKMTTHFVPSTTQVDRLTVLEERCQHQPHWAKIGVSAGLCPSGSRGRSISMSSPAFRGCPCSLVAGHHWDLCFPPRASSPDSGFLPPSCKDAGEAMGSVCIIRDNLPILKSFISDAKHLLLSMGKRLQVSWIRTWTSLGEGSIIPSSAPVSSFAKQGDALYLAGLLKGQKCCKVENEATKAWPLPFSLPVPAFCGTPRAHPQAWLSVGAQRIPVAMNQPSQGMAPTSLALGRAPCGGKGFRQPEEEHGTGCSGTPIPNGFCGKLN